jgi:two-component system, chemotaxis family, protein-glutamate methylesterase/glutaminase
MHPSWWFSTSRRLPSGFVDWLGRTSKMPVGIATHGERIVPGRVYIAPDGLQMMVGAGGKILLSTDEPENGLRPSVSCLFRSAANIYGQHAIGVLLTGMGKDGAEELRLMKEKGSITIAQDEESSVVYGMPGEAIRLGGADYVLSPGRIAAALTTLAQKREMAQ